MCKARALLGTALWVVAAGCTFPDYSVDASVELQPDGGHDSAEGTDTAADGFVADAGDSSAPPGDGGRKTCLELGGATYAGHCYWVTAGTNQQGAKILCAGNEGHLATLSTPAENDFVFKLATATQRWIGLQAPLPSTKKTDFTWVTGEAKPFEFWASTGPTGGGACVTIDGPTGNWFDRNCATALSATCERDSP